MRARYAIALVAAVLLGFGAKLFFFSAPTAVADVGPSVTIDTSEFNGTSQIFRSTSSTTCHSSFPNLINRTRTGVPDNIARHNGGAGRGLTQSMARDYATPIRNLEGLVPRGLLAFVGR